MSERGRKRTGLLMAILLVVVIIWNPIQSKFLTSLSNQEFFSYHIKDLISGIWGETYEGQMDGLSNEYETEKNGPHFGVASNRNVVIIQVESLQNFVIGRTYNGQELTPNLNRLLEENTTYFPRFYQQIGSGNTSDAEFAVNHSLYGTLASYTYKLYPNNYFRGLPVLLKERGYDTAVFHAFEDQTFWNREEAYPAIGFDRFYGGLNDQGRDGDYTMTEWMGWGLTDSEFYPQTIEFMKQLNQPFYGLVISLSNHHPYEMLPHYRFIDLYPEDKGTIVGNYLNSVAYTDYALGLFFEDLKAEGLYDNTLFLIYGDHVGLTQNPEINQGMERLLGREYGPLDMLNIPLLIHLPSAENTLKGEILTVGGQTDILPTIAYLLGWEELDTLYVGHNIYTVKQGFVAQQTYMPKGSFISDDLVYIMSRDGIFEHGEAFDFYTGKLLPLEQARKGYERSISIVNTSEYILKSDALRKIYLEGKALSEVDGEKISRTHPDVIGVVEQLSGDHRTAQILEALTATYGQGYQTLYIRAEWNQDSQPYVIFGPENQQSMNWDQLIEWMENHGNAQIVVDIPKSGDYLMQYTKSRSEAAASQMIPIYRSSQEYSGRYEGILWVSSETMSWEEQKNFAKSHRVWALISQQEIPQEDLANLTKEGTSVYVFSAGLGTIRAIH
jgi:hypothetical protein